MSNHSSDPFTALRSGDTDAVARAIIADPAIAWQRDPEGVSLLMNALYARQRDLAKLILEQLEELDVFEVAALGRLGDLKDVVERSAAALTKRSPDGYTALHLAAFFGHADLVAWMLSRGAPVDAIAANSTLVRPLHSAVVVRSLPVVELLLNAGADPNSTQRGGWTPLHAAARNGDLAIVDLLLKKGADVSLRNDAGQTAADLAGTEGHTGVVERLKR